MALPTLEWESLDPAERLALVAAGESGPLAFTALWYNISQADIFRINWHHHLYDLAARRMISGEAIATIINIPPGGTKTEFWSIHLPVYCMVEHPRVRILNASYSKDLADENSERSRNLIKSAEFQQFYHFDLGKNRVDDWTVNRAGKRTHQLFSRSSGGQIPGVRGGYMGDGFTGYVAADDWDKVDDAFSETKRAKSHTRLINTLRSRRAHSRTPFLFIQQRVHADDSSAWLLAGKMGLTIDSHVKIPALIDQDYIDGLPDGIRERCVKSICGTPRADGYWSYWPEKEDIGDLVALRDANPYTFASQYMQDPASLSGGIFDPDDFVYFGDVDQGADIPLPETYDYRLITVDTAQKTENHHDWTVFAEWGVTRDHLYRLALRRERMEAHVLRREMETFVRAAHEKNRQYEHGVLRAVLVEDKASGTGLIQELRGRLPIDITPVPRHRDKLSRAMDVQPHHKAKRVALPYGDGANYEFVSEIAAFSADDSHRHDDQTDVMIDALDETFVRGGFGSVGLMVKRHHRGR